jgi:hypothetical protein
MNRRSPELMNVFAAAGGIGELAAKLGLSRQAVGIWHKVPFKHLNRVSDITGIPRQLIRPDLFDDERLILQMFDRGMNTADIARALQTSEASVAFALARSLEGRREKVGTDSPAAAVNEPPMEDR